MATQSIPYFTEEQYLEAERMADYKSEYLDGQVFAMAGASLEHVLIAGNVARHLGNGLHGKNCFVFTSDLRVKVPAARLYTYPDVAVVCGTPEIVSTDNLVNPKVLIEVLSKKTENHDRGWKLDQYRAVPSLTDYVIISQTSRFVEHYFRLSERQWRLDIIDESIGVVHVESIGVSLTFEQIYERIERLRA